VLGGRVMVLYWCEKSTFCEKCLSEWKRMSNLVAQIEQCAAVVAWFLLETTLLRHY
jgi:hypothetical protein